MARARAGSFGALQRQRIPSPGDARRDRNDPVAGRGRRFHRRSAIPASEPSWSIGFSTARNMSITGRSKWGDVLRVNSEKLGAQGMLAFNLWLREAFRSNMHVDRMAEELVTAQGSIFSNGPANYYRVATSPGRPGRDDGPGFHGRAPSVCRGATIIRSRRMARTITIPWPLISRGYEPSGAMNSASSAATR